MTTHTIARNIYAPIIRKVPSEIFVSRNMFNFVKINELNNKEIPLRTTINYYVKKPTYLGYSHSLSYSSVLDITYLDYSFMVNPLVYDSIKNEYIFPTKEQIEFVKKEFDYMLHYFKINEVYDFFLIDDNVYVNFTTEEVN